MKLNLNEVEALTSGNIINELTKNLKEVEKVNLSIILDCPSVNLVAWKKQLMKYVKDKSLEKNILCEHKADFKYPVVSAASIIAKTTRDAEIEKLKKQYGVDFGSGYPADPFTIKFLKENATNPKYKGIFRESWQTWKDAVNDKDRDQKKLF
jgi:ribonuclease HII